MNVKTSVWQPRQSLQISSIHNKASRDGSSFLTEAEFNLKYRENSDPEHYLSLKYIIKTSVQKLGRTIENFTLTMPFQPPLVRLINYSEKGMKCATAMN